MSTSRSDWKRQWLLSWVFSLSPLHIYPFILRKDSCCVLSYPIRRAAHVSGQQSAKDLRPVNGHRNEFVSRSLPGWAFRWLSPWCRLVRDSEPETPSYTPGFLTHRSCEIMHTLCLKVLSFRVICCAAVNNKYNITSSFLVTMILKHNPRKEE